MATARPINIIATPTILTAKKSGKQITFYKIGETVAGNPPVLTVISTPADAKSPIILQLYDTDPGLRTYMIWYRLGGSNGQGIIVHDGTVFWPGWAVNSKKTGSGTYSDPYIFTIYRDFNWPEDSQIDVYVRAIDANGNLLNI